MEFEKGQLINIPITFDDGKTKKRFFLVQSADKLFPIVTGYNITSIGEHDTRKYQYLTNVALIPNSDNNLPKPSVIKMNQEFILDRRKTVQVIGHLREDEQQIVDLYEKQYRAAGLISSANLDNLDKDMRRQYELFNAINTDDDKKVNQLLNAGASVDESQLGVTQLHYVAQCGALRSAATHIARGAYVDALDGEKKTPLYYAVANNDFEMSKTLLDAGANPDLRVGNKKVREMPCSKELGQLLEAYSPDLNKKSGLSLGRD